MLNPNLPMRRLVVVDTHYLCWRAFYALGSRMSVDDIQTGVLFGVFTDILDLISLWGSHRLVFCFDSAESERKKIYPGYKGSRKKPEPDPEVARQKKQLRDQVQRLQESILPQLGFYDVFSYSGFESDDIIARIVQTNRKLENCITIISADQDLYQLLRKNVVMYNPRTKSVMTRNSFMREYQILPSAWSMVKAIAGCHTDSVPGIVGVGEVTAIRYLRGTLRPGKTMASIAGNRDLITRNLSLVKLPFLNTPTPLLVGSRPTAQRWDRVMIDWKMRSLVGKFQDPEGE